MTPTGTLEAVLLVLLIKVIAKAPAAKCSQNYQGPSPSKNDPAIVPNAERDGEPNHDLCMRTAIFGVLGKIAKAISHDSL